MDGATYVLIHQAGLAYPAVPQDDNLRLHSQPKRLWEFHALSTLRRTFFREAIVVVYVAACGVEKNASAKW